jgi:hypothetical protein
MTPGIFHEKWLSPTVEPVNKLVWRMSAGAQFDILTGAYIPSELLARQQASIASVSASLGPNIYVALSGGIDSQAACLLLRRANVKFTIVIMQFRDDLNIHDVSSAITFCTTHRFKYTLVDFNILSFLGRDLPSYVVKYNCPSPQLSAHCRFYEMLIERFAPSAIICGGNPPCIRDGKWEFISNRSHSVWMTFAEINKYPLVGNFLGYTLDIALPFMLFQPDMPTDIALRYIAKVTGMHRLGLSVIPQQQKYTGFELVKEHFANMTGDGWAFEKFFRLPHHSKYPEYDSLLELPEEITEVLRERHALAQINKEE